VLLHSLLKFKRQQMNRSQSLAVVANLLIPELLDFNIVTGVQQQHTYSYHQDLLQRTTLAY
jgi:site-specific recombinase